MALGRQPLALIIEDDKDVARLFACAVQDAGFDTEIAYCGDSAMLWLLSETPAIVVLDMHLPRVKGKDILSQIRSDERLAETRVIVATADPALADAYRQEEGVDLVLVKPISFAQLRDLSERIGQGTPFASGQVPGVIGT